MRKLFTFMLLLVVMILVGCGSKYSDETYLKASGAWVEEKENIAGFLNASGLDEEGVFDEEYLMQQIFDKKVYLADKEEKVAVIGELNGGKVVEIKFMQGRNKNKIGYTVPELLIDLKAEREKAIKKQEEKSKEECSRQEQEQANYEKAIAEDKARMEQITLGDGEQIKCVMGVGNEAYRKLIGKTKMPEGTRLTIRILNVEKSAVVQQGGLFTALFEKSLIPEGEQNVTIERIDETSQPVEVYTLKIKA